MKLIIAIVQDEDAGDVITNLNQKKFQVTRLATKGGFLRTGNTTLLTGVEDEELDVALHIIEDNSRARTQKTYMPSSYGTMYGVIMPPVVINVGGATVFVLDVDQFHKF